MAERSEAVEEQAVRDASAIYSVEPEIATAEDVPPGYKRTEVGVIPEDWRVEPILEVVQLPNGQVNPKLEPYRSMILVAPDHIEEGTGALLARSSAAAQGAISGKFIFEPGDVIYSKIRPYLKKAFLASFRGLCSADMYPLRPRLGISSGFILNTLLSDRFTEFAISVSARSGIPKINRQELAQYKIATPPDDEQRAIATALSDADALIASLDRLIAKKRAIKQAAMQQLLTGQTRLPGFTGEWETKRLGDVGTFYKGQGIRRDDVSDEGVPCIRYGEIYTQYSDCVVSPESHIPETVAETAFSLRSGDILFAGSGETAEEIGMCVAYLGDEPAFAGGDIVVLRPNEGVSAYLGRLLNHPTISQQKARLGQGDAVVHISARNLAQIEVHLPKQEEQTAIAAILSDMDTEIEALEHRRDKARQIKQSMMQQLLTGRVRLVEPESSKEAIA